MDKKKVVFIILTVVSMIITLIASIFGIPVYLPAFGYDYTDAAPAITSDRHQTASAVCTIFRVSASDTETA